mgnify:CR=1 FL=1|jgi:D-sedoheptulose 7-phosphate isomerase
MDYNNKYIQTFNEGMLAASSFVDRKLITNDLFLENLNDLTKEIKHSSGRIFFFGNGASSSFANHMALDWSKNGGILSLSLSDSALLTALSNDYSYFEAFVEFMKINHVNSNDLVVTISSSGNSKNIVNVLKYCSENSLNSLSLSGLNEDNKSLELSKYAIYYPFRTYGMVECAHQLFLHVWLDRYMDIKDWNKIESQNMDANNFKI